MQRGISKSMPRGLFQPGAEARQPKPASFTRNLVPLVPLVLSPLAFLVPAKASMDPRPRSCLGFAAGLHQSLRATLQKSASASAPRLGRMFDDKDMGLLPLRPRSFAGKGLDRAGHSGPHMSEIAGQGSGGKGNLQKERTDVDMKDEDWEKWKSRFAGKFVLKTGTATGTSRRAAKQEVDISGVRKLLTFAVVISHLFRGVMHIARYRMWELQCGAVANVAPLTMAMGAGGYFLALTTLP